MSYHTEPDPLTQPRKVDPEPDPTQTFAPDYITTVVVSSCRVQFRNLENGQKILGSESRNFHLPLEYFCDD